MEIVKQVTLDLLPTTEPALSATSDVPIIETKPDASPVKDVPAAPEEKEAKPEESATPDKPESEDSSATPDEAKKPAKGVQKRIDELTRQREDERRAREAAEARELRILGALERATGVHKELPPNTDDTEPVKPQKGSFDNPDAYDQALETYVTERAGWIARKEVKSQIEAQNKKMAEEAQQRSIKTAQEAFLKREQEVKQKYPDYQSVAESPDIQVSMPVAHAIFYDEQGPNIKYYLGKHPEEAKRILDMTITDPNGTVMPDVARQLVELGTIRARLMTPPPVTQPVSAAPKPISPISKTTTPTLTPEEESMDQYAERRKKELNSVRPGVRH